MCEPSPCCARVVRANHESARQEMMTDGSWAGQVCMQPYRCSCCVTFCQAGSYARRLLLRHKGRCSQMELQATSLVFNVNIVLHQASQVRVGLLLAPTRVHCMPDQYLSMRHLPCA